MLTHTILMTVCRNPSLATLMNTVSMQQKGWQLSHMQCAILCKIESCQSFAYHPTTGQCFIKNVNVQQTGVLCGMAVDQGRELCLVHRDAYIAYGGKKQSPLECVCGYNRQMTSVWTPFSSDAFNCIDTCSSSICNIKLGFDEPCASCNGNVTYCKPGLALSATPKMSICARAAQ